MTHSNDEHKKREGLLGEAAEAKRNSPKLIEKGRNLTEAGQSAHDSATAFEELARKAPDGFFSGPNFDHVLSGFREFNSMAREQSDLITTDEILIRLSRQITTSATISSTAAATTCFGPKAVASPELKSLEMLLHRTIDVDSVVKLMKLVGLDIGRGSKRTPVQLLQTAQQAFKRPFASEGYAVAVLVPLRESIQGSINELLKKRPTTEKTGRWKKKITSIGQHCGKSDVSSNQIERVAAITHALIDELSGAKDRNMTRERIAGLLDQGVALLQDFLSLIDRTKLRAIAEK
jgi:hypothetical protein